MTASVSLLSAMNNTVSMTAHKICFGLRKYILWSGWELSPVIAQDRVSKAHFSIFSPFNFIKNLQTPKKMEGQILIQKNMLST